MRGINGTYFDPQLRADGHYIITGQLNDTYCSDSGPADFRFYFHNWLRYREGFDAVIWLDGLNMIYTFDQQSYNAMRSGGTSAEVPVSSDSGEDQGPLRHRTRRHIHTEQTSPAASAAGRGPLHMGYMSMPAAWQQLTALLRNPDISAALVINNVNSLQHTMRDAELQLLTELSSYHQTNHSVVIYNFRDTTLSTILDSANHGSGQWATFVETTLHPRITTDDPDQNRVINLGYPGRDEIRNLLNYMRLFAEPHLQMNPWEIGELAEILEGACVRKKWNLKVLHTKLKVCANEGTPLQVDSWKEFTGEQKYLPPLTVLDKLIGLADVKQQLHTWYDVQQRNAAVHGQNGTAVFSRLIPSAVIGSSAGYSMNIVLKGKPGTGKTSFARIYGELCKQVGLLPHGQLIPVSANDLVSPNVGGTAPLVRERVQEAMGGVLLIDEAYALATNRFGQEAINQLVNDMSAYEGQFAVILAGYPAEMDDLISRNPGLTSRIPTVFELPDYTPAEMNEMFHLKASSAKEPVVIDPALEARLGEFFEGFVNAGSVDPHWGNGREVENLLAAMTASAQARQVHENQMHPETVLTAEDIPESFRIYLVPHSRDLQEAVRKINDLIGLKSVKKILRERINNLILNSLSGGGPGNYIFYGPPGTGKTTVTEIFGEALGHMGMLKRKVNNVVAVKAAELLDGSRNLADTAAAARGGILFIDEAHQLKDSPAGRAILRALVPIVEDPAFHSDTAVILAGYAAEMKAVLEVDPGLSRRFPEPLRIRFNDYTAGELVQILKQMAEKAGQIPTEGYLNRSRAALIEYLRNRPANFGNGGFIRETWLPESITARTKRLAKAATGKSDAILTAEEASAFSEEEKHLLTEADLPEAFDAYAGPIGMEKQEETAESMLADLTENKAEFVSFVRSKADMDTKEKFYDRTASFGKHIAIIGNSGTGRKTAAKALAAAFREAGILERDDVSFRSKGNFEGQYVGQTVPRTVNCMEEAAGGVLCIENPGSMLPKNSNDNSYGTEALGALAGGMSTYQKDTVFVWLDTKEGMEALFKAYPSIRAGLAAVFEFEDLTPEEMHRIFNEKTCHSYQFDESVKPLLDDFFINWVCDRGGLGESARSWGNGTEVDQLITALSANWKNAGGSAVTVTDGGSTYSVRRITKSMFPDKLQKYLKKTSADKDTAMDEFRNMTGMSSAKKSVENIARRVRNSRKEQIVPGCYCFLGNPGCGKTTAGNLMGGILKASGALSQGHVVSRTARQMCEQLDQFDDILRMARNGILFIDEAHQLRQYGSAGDAVIKRLLTAVEDITVTRNTCFILAGYPAEMLEMLKTDPGLQSRFGKSDSILMFEDYTPNELLRIMDQMAVKADRIPEIGSAYPLQCEEGYRSAALRVFRSACRVKDFGNGRFVRNLLHDSIDTQLARLEEEFGIGMIPEEERRVLKKEDIPEQYRTLSEKARQNAVISEEELVHNASSISAEKYDAKCTELYGSTVLLEVRKNGQTAGSGTGTIITSSGYVLTCNHVVADADEIRAKVYTPGAIGGDFHWFDCEICDSYKDCDLGVVRMKGSNFHAMPIRREYELIRQTEETLLLGYPLGQRLNGGDYDQLRPSNFRGRISSSQMINGIERFYIDTTGLHGNSGSPVISLEDGCMIGVFSGSVTSGKLDELNYFYPISYFYQKYLHQEKRGE